MHQRSEWCTHRVEQRLRRVTEDKREADDDSGKRHERCNGVVAVEDEQTDEDEDENSHGEQDSVELRHRRTDILQAGCQRLPLAVNTPDSFTHLTLRDVTVTILVEQCERSMLDMVLSNPEPLKQEHEYVLRRPSSGSMDRSLCVAE